MEVSSQLHPCELPGIVRRGSPSGGLLLDTAIDLFLEAGELAGRSPETVLWHRKKLAAFSAFARQMGLVRVSDVTLEHGRAFVRHLIDRDVLYPDHPSRPAVDKPLADTTIAGYVRSLKAWAAWLADEGHTSEHLFRKLKIPKVRRVLKRPLGEAEIRQLLVAVDRSRPEGVRAFALVLLLLDTGIRVSEAVNARLIDLDTKAGTLFVMGKGSKERRVPIGLDTRRALLQYIQQCRPAAASLRDSRIFLTGSGEPLTRDAVEKLFDRLERRSGVRVHPHLMRNTFAVRFLKNGGDAFALQRILGHTSLDTTRIYVELASEDLKEMHRRTSPVDTLNVMGRRRGRPRRSA